MMEARCENCRFWHDQRYLKQLNQEGQCRRRVPQPIGLFECAEHENSLLGTWPHTRCDDWCGEYRLRLPEEEAVQPPLAILKLSTKTHRLLVNGGRIRSTKDLIESTRSDLLSIPGLDKTALTEVEAALKRHRLSLKGARKNAQRKPSPPESASAAPRAPSGQGV